METYNLLSIPPDLDRKDVEKLLTKRIRNGSIIQRDMERLSNRKAYEVRTLITYSEKKLSHISTYLDIGCGDGEITKKIGDIHNIPAIYGTDTVEPKQIRIKFKLTNGSVLDYPDSTFDLITCFNSLHHVDPEKMDDLIREVVRVGKENFYFIITEHSCTSDDSYTRKLVEFEHSLHLDPMIVRVLRSEDEWNKYLQSFGFKFVYTMRVKKNNPTKYFTTLYYKGSSAPHTEQLCDM